MERLSERRIATRLYVDFDSGSLKIAAYLTGLVIGARFDCRDDKFRDRVLEMILD